MGHAMMSVTALAAAIDREELEHRAAIMAWATFYRREYRYDQHEALRRAHLRHDNGLGLLSPQHPFISKLATFHLQRLLREVT